MVEAVIEEPEVTEPENPGETLPVRESLATESVPEPSNEVKEVPVDVEPVIATPLSNFAVPEHVVESVVTEEAPAIDPVEDVTPDIVTEEKPAVDKPEAPAPEPRENVEEPASVVAAPVEEPEPSPEVTEQEVPAHAVSEPTAGPATEEETASGVFELDVPVPEPQEPEAEPELATPAIFESVEAAQDVPTLDIPQEETKHVGRPWARSYSVSSQGGGLGDTALADAKDVEPTTAPEPPVEEPAPEIVTPAEVRVPSVLSPSWKIYQPLF